MSALAPSSDRVAGARRWGNELRKAVGARGYSQRRLAADIGISRSRIGNWACGDSLPSVETASRIADLLMWPSLVDLARAGREKTCDACGRVFTVETPSPQRYCSTDCRRFKAKSREARRDLTRAVLERRANRYRDAVAAMCAGCEPSGLCRTAECPLQVAGVSPLPIAKGAVA